MARRSTSTAQTFAPDNALRHPLWLSACVVLVINDHLLKGMATLPGALTGKLSDIAGMIVAPTLLAVLLRLRSTRALFSAHVATGLGFAAINISHSAARGFETLTALTPFPWTIWVDPSDLIVLPTLGLSWMLLIPAMSAPKATPRLAIMVLAPLGLIACMATSSSNDPPTTTEPEWMFPDVWGHLGIWNDTGETVTVRVRELHDSAFMDCEFVAQDPSASLSRALFGNAQYWEVEPGRVMGVLGEGSIGVPECKAFLIDGAGLETQLLFLHAEDYPAGWIPSMGPLPDDVSLRIEVDATELSPHPVRFDAPPIVLPEAGPECALIDPEDALAWSTLPEMDLYEIKAIEQAPDGCMKLTLSAYEWYLCLPRDTFPFGLNEIVFLRPISLGEDFGSIDGFEITGAYNTLRVGRGQDVVPFEATTTLSVQGSEGCGYVHDECGNVTLPLTLRYGGPSGVPVKAGEALALGESSYLFVVRAFDLPVGNTDCLPDAAQSDRLIESVYVGQSGGTQ